MFQAHTSCARRLETKVVWIVSHIPDVLAVGFAVLAAAYLFGGRREADARRHYPRGFREVTGTLLAVAAGLLAYAPTRLIGLAAAAFVLFLSAITLLHRRQYGYAAPVIVALFALI